MNSETACTAKRRPNIIVGGQNVLHLNAKIWQNIKKDNIENIEQEIDLEGERGLLIHSNKPRICLILG